MIFVTVGTHEQPFNRLIKKVDELKRDGIIKEDVIMQIGFSTYIPKYCEYKKLFSYDEMIENVKKARIVITHGGPSSFIMPLQEGKIPVVVPRKLKFHEHVNDHQVEFVRMENERYKNIIIVEDEQKLGRYIKNYDSIVTEKNGENINNNSIFNDKFEKIVETLIKKS
ncbi:glycosyl transferase cpsg [Ligilactobacillus hayakitensis DSM 18933 = JCM 14209]|uniref:Glycosyl transferase cpsg n=1 Tax=Ligilactobacillus hayakitensis DSM 18933 = JCM 14209 TaxID=1423755 RepID=A0A0R1WRR1_9LACO|nr:glycosyltransferase [Ligilactobacillus hayakitensis]KRM20133.1 glycosyl transferase cpsg [Ligilactobacillus hayakitensis DSM 18933 = JCM 14209]